MPLSLRRGTVTAIAERHEGLVRCEVDGVPCVAYPRLTGPVVLGDDVLVNVQARELGLGSGGFDVLHANLTRGLGLAVGPRRRGGRGGGERGLRPGRARHPVRSRVARRGARAAPWGLAPHAGGARTVPRRRHGRLAGRVGGAGVAAAARRGRRHRVGGRVPRPRALAYGTRARRGSVVLRVRVRRGQARAPVIERALGPVVGLGTWNTFGADRE